jgi:hypothetical protein
LHSSKHTGSYVLSQFYGLGRVQSLMGADLESCILNAPKLAT